jgi:glycosyltransferase involved in cell wall biosynthesis
VLSMGALLPRHRRSAVTVFDWGPFRDSGMAVRSRALWSSAMLMSLRRASAVHLLSEATAQSTPAFLARTIAAKDVAVGGVTPYPVLAARMRPGGPLVHLGSPVSRRRLHLLREAAERNSELRVLLAGDGTEEMRTSNVEALGRIEEEDLVTLIDAARAVVLLSEYEGIGLPVTEAAARGCPALVSQAVANAQPAWVQRHLTIVDPLDPRALDSALVSVGTVPVPPDRGVGSASDSTYVDMVTRLAAL